MSDLPKAMRDTHICILCKKEMKIDSAFLRDDESAVEVWHECECGQRFGIAFQGGHIGSFKQAMGMPVTSEDGSQVVSPQEVSIG